MYNAACGKLLHSAKGLFLSGLHAVLGIGLTAANLVAGAWGGVAWLRKQPSVVFWYLLRIAQALVVAEVVLGLLLLARGDRADEGLHLLYGIAPLAVTLVSEGMRVGASQRELEGVEDIEALERREQAAIARRVVLREMGVMTVGALLIVTLALRALQSGY
jgi:hypothetical protein